MKEEVHKEIRSLEQSGNEGSVVWGEKENRCCFDY